MPIIIYSYMMPVSKIFYNLGSKCSTCYLNISKKKNPIIRYNHYYSFVCITFCKGNDNFELKLYYNT